MTESGTTRRTILVVDDDEDTRYVSRLSLEQRGYRVLEACEGEEALDVARGARPDVILMDLGLPVLDGLRAAERVRAEPELRDTLILAVTGHNDQEHREGARAAGINAFVTKPVDFDWLDDLLKQLLPEG